jgi:hypothetical protein
VARPKTEHDGACLRWSGPHKPTGYPLHAGQLVTRTVWQHQRGPIPRGVEIVHTTRCRFRDCVRLSHLRAVDPATHCAELAALGRYRHGEQHWNAKLSEVDARFILHSTRPTAELASDFDVGAGTINGIRARRNWRHLT